ECGPGLFDFTSRLAGGAGPVIDPPGALGVRTESVVALDPVPLDGLNQSAELNSFVLEEGIPARDVDGDGQLDLVDLNGDGEFNDHVVKLADRMTGLVRAIGDNGSEGRAVVRVKAPPFSFPAIATEGDVVAFLEPETAQGNADENGNGQKLETIL